jgi:hypothetical protein
MSKIYLDQDVFLKHIKESQLLGYPTNELANDWIILIDHLQKSKYFSQYRKDILDDMKGECLYVMVKKFKLYNCKKNTSPFSYFTKLAFNTSYNVFRKMKRQWDLQDKYLNDAIESLKDDGIIVKREKPNDK